MLNSRLATTEQFAKFELSDAILFKTANCNYFLFCKSRISVLLSARITSMKYIKAVAHIPALINPFQVFERVVLSITVQMIALNIWRHFCNERTQDKASNMNGFSKPAPTENYRHITRRILAWRKNFFSINIPSSIKKAFNSAKVTNFVQSFPFGNWFPSFHKYKYGTWISKVQSICT